MATSSAPGKVYLFGEHAVVYGEPAIPCAVDLRARVEARRRDDGRVRVDAADLSVHGLTVEYSGTMEARPEVDVPEHLVEAAMGYVDGAIRHGRALAGVEDRGLELSISSEIPLGAGLGSSAAVTVAAIDAVAREFGADPDPATVADLAYRTEAEVQDGRASRADTFCSAMGGAVRVEGDDRRTIEAPSLPFTIGYDGGAGETGELVEGVRRLRERYDFATETVSTIGLLTRAGEGALAEGDVDEIGRLMDFNHGLLEALGVSSRTLDDMVWAARDAGAAGAKLTGAGGGGCIVALSDAPVVTTALEHAPACEHAFEVRLTPTGLRRE
ncbi:MAG: mevalonate kinase [Halobacteriales archaeon]